MREEFIFPPPAPPDSPFQLRLAGTSYCDGSYLIARRNSGDWVIEFVERGRGTLEVDGRTCHPEAGDLYFVPAGSTHRYWSSAEEPWVKHWMNFSGELIRELVLQYCPGGRRNERLLYQSEEIELFEGESLMERVTK